MTRNDLLGAWLAYYKARGTARSLALIDANLRTIRGNLMRHAHRPGLEGLRVFQGMAYGIHQHCRFLLNRGAGG